MGQSTMDIRSCVFVFIFPFLYSLGREEDTCKKRPDDGCPKYRRSGGIFYSLNNMTINATEEGCDNGCVYTRKRVDGTLQYVCFKAGGNEDICLDGPQSVIDMRSAQRKYIPLEAAIQSATYKCGTRSP